MRVRREVGKWNVVANGTFLSLSSRRIFLSLRTHVYKLEPVSGTTALIRRKDKKGKGGRGEGRERERERKKRKRGDDGVSR